MRSNVVLRYATALVLVAALGSCATPDTSPSETLTTLMPDSARWFKISWETVPEAGGQVRLRGYIENTYGEAAGKVQLLAQALDGSGKLVGQKLQWLPGVIPGFGRVYFEVPGLPPADHYRVTVWAYERLQGRNGVVVPR